MRCGRITASKFKSACHTDPASPSISLITAICYPEAVALALLLPTGDANMKRWHWSDILHVVNPSISGYHKHSTMPSGEENVRKAKKKFFFEMGILPELLGRWFSCPPEQNTSSPSTSTGLPPRGRFEMVSPSSQGTNLKYYYCQEGEHGKMVGCDNPGCPYQWFHLECLRLKSAPRLRLWYCPDSCKREKFRKSK